MALQLNLRSCLYVFLITIISVWKCTINPPLIHLTGLCFSVRCLNSWRPSSPTWRSLPANINKRFARTPSSGSSFRKCVPPLVSTHLPVTNCPVLTNFNQIEQKSVFNFWNTSLCFFLTVNIIEMFPLFLHSWKRILVGDAWCWGFLLWARCTNHWSLPGSEAQKWRFVTLLHKLLFPFSTVKQKQAYIWCPLYQHPLPHDCRIL